MAGFFPGSIHIRDVGLKGAPPKVLWLVVGNTSTQNISRILLTRRDVIVAFIKELNTSLLTLR